MCGVGRRVEVRALGRSLGLDSILLVEGHSSWGWEWVGWDEDLGKKEKVGRKARRREHQGNLVGDVGCGGGIFKGTFARWQCMCCPRWAPSPLILEYLLLQGLYFLRGQWLCIMRSLWLQISLNPLGGEVDFEIIDFGGKNKGEEAVPHEGRYGNHSQEKRKWNSCLFQEPVKGF